MYYYIYAIICSYCCFISSNVQDSKIINDIQQRYYIIRRLEKPVATLTSIQDKKEGSRLSLIYTKYTQYFKHPRISALLHNLDKAQSIAPFYDIWSDVLSYKYIENQDFIKEVLTVILLLYKNLILSAQTHSPSAQKCIHAIDAVLENQAPEQDDLLSILSIANSVHKHYKTLTSCKELTTILTTPHTIQPIHSGTALQTVEQDLTAVHTLLDGTAQHNIAQANTMRFYYIQRLLKSMFMLSRKKTNQELNIDESILTSFTSPWVKKYMKLIIEKKNLDPLFDAWSQLTTYDFINNDTYIREFIQSTYLIYYCSIHATTLRSDRDKKNDVLFVYETLSNLPVSELLDLLDDMVEQYDMLSAEYALHDTSLTWNQWLKQYWWAAPIVVGSLCLTLLQHPKLLMLFGKL